MTTVRAASSATLSVALVPRRAAVLREAPAQEEVVREAVLRVAVLQGNRTVVAVEPADMMTMISIHHAVVVEAAEDDFLVTKPTKPSKQ